jgi:hypothetical protein
MVKAHSPLFSLGARGTLADCLTFSQLKSSPIVKRKPSHADAQSARQLEQREKFFDAKEYWSTLSAVEKKSWSDNAARLGFTGWNLFLSEFLKHPEDFDMIPSGLIALWSGPSDEIPDGWFLCDGNNGTPDLREHFVVGANYYDGDKWVTQMEGTPKQTGGSSVHDHTLPDFTGNEVTTSGGLWRDSGGTAHHKHTLGGNTGYISPTIVLVPYFSLAYIMKS